MRGLSCRGIRDALAELKAAVVMGAQMIRDIVRLELEARR